jgi:protein associated with RNAse G/E
VRAEKEAEGQAITVCTYKYDGTEHRRWHARLLRREESLIVLDARFEEEIRHPLLGIIAAGTISLEHYWLDRWYNIFRFLQPTGEMLNYYCNINVPPSFAEDVLSYVDLDIDILVAPDFSYSVLDEDEFTINAERYHYPLEVQRSVSQALEELLALIELRRFPFNDFK